MRFLSGRNKKEPAANNVQQQSKSNDPVEVMVDIDKPSASNDAASDRSVGSDQRPEANRNVAEPNGQQTGGQRDQMNHQSNSHQPNSHQSNSHQSNNHQSNNHDHLNKPKRSSVNETTSLLNEPRKASASSASTVNNEDTPDDEDRNEKISHKSILKSLIKKFLISFAVLLAVYFIGYFHLSFAWILICQVLYFICLAHQIRTKNRLLAARELEDEEKYVKRVLVDLPNWVLFPDQERVEFLNKSLKQMWPFLNLYLQKFMRDVVIPDIINYLPDYMKGLKFETIDLGTVPVRIGSIKCHTERSSRMEILLDLQIIYAGNSNIKVKFLKFAAGVKDLQLFGMLRVRLYPLTEHLPLIGSLSCTFLNSPKIDFNLTNLANIFDLPGLNNLIRSAISEQIASRVVYPNVFVIPLSDIPMKTLKFNPPLGVIRIEIIEAKDLLKADFGIMGLGKSDPYCKIAVSSFNLQTQVIPNTINPQFNFICEIAIGDLDDQEIDIEVYDKDQNTADDFLGRLTLRLAEYDCTGEKSHWIPLDDTTTGSLHVKLTWLKLSSDLSKLESQAKSVERIKLIYSNSMKALKQPQQKSTISSELTEIAYGSSFVCMVYLDCIRYLPKINQTEPSTQVVILLGTRRRKSIVIESNCNPVYEQNFLFLCDQLKDESPLKLEIHETKSKKMIGRTALSLSNLIAKGRLSFDKPIHVRINQNLDCVLRVAVELRVLYQSGFKPKRAPISAHQDSFKSSGSGDKTDNAEDNVIIEEPPEKDNIPSLDQMVMSTVQPFIRTMEWEPEPSGPAKKDTQPNKSSNHLDVVKSDSLNDIPRKKTNSLTYEAPPKRDSIASSISVIQKPKISLSFKNLNDIEHGPITVVVHRVVNLPGQVDQNTFFYVKIRRFPHRSKKQVRTKSVYNTDSPMFNESFHLLNPRSHPLTQLEIRVFRGRLWSLFRAIKLTRQITRIVVDLTQISEANVTKYFGLEDIPKAM